MQGGVCCRGPGALWSEGVRRTLAPWTVQKPAMRPLSPRCHVALQEWPGLRKIRSGVRGSVPRGTPGLIPT